MSDDVKALIAEARRPAVVETEYGPMYRNDHMLIERLADALEASVQAPESADYLFENPEPVAVPPEFFERLAQVAEAPEPVQTPAVDRGALVRVITRWHNDPVAASNEILASGILLDAAEVEARGLEKAAGEYAPGASGASTARIRKWLRARAQQVREGN